MEPQFPQSELPITHERRTELLIALAGQQASLFVGTVRDLIKLAEAYTLRTGCDDAWLVELAHRNGVYRAGNRTRP